MSLDQHVGCFIFWALKINATIAFSADIFWYIGIGFPEFILRNFGQSVSSFAKYHSTVVKTWLYQSTTHLHLHGIKIFIGSHPYQLLLLSVILILIFLMEVYLFSFSIQLSFKYFLCIVIENELLELTKKKKKNTHTTEQGFIKRVRQMLDEGFSNLATKSK